MDYSKILLPLDGSELAERAIPHAEELARCFQAQLFLLRVVFQRQPMGGVAQLRLGKFFSEENIPIVLGRLSYSFVRKM